MSTICLLLFLFRCLLARKIALPLFVHPFTDGALGTCLCAADGTKVGPEMGRNRDFLSVLSIVFIALLFRYASRGFCSLELQCSFLAFLSGIICTSLA